MKLMYKIILIISILVLIAIALFCIYPGSADSEDHEPILIDLKGTWSVASDSDIILNVIFADDKSSNVLSNCEEEMSISFDNKNIDVQNYELSRGDSYKKMRLYSLVMTAHSKEIGKQVLSKFYIHCNSELIMEKSIDIVLYVTAPQSGKELAIIENTASSAIFDIYQFSIKNAGTSTIISDELLFGDFENSIKEVILDVNGKFVDQNGFVTLDPNDELNAVIKFKYDDSSSIKMFAPTLEYHFDNDSKSYIYNFPFAIYGLPFSGDALADLYSDFISKE